jgi:hypothetical protein
MKMLQSVWDFLVEWGVAWAEYRNGQTDRFNGYI